MTRRSLLLSGMALAAFMPCGALAAGEPAAAMIVRRVYESSLDRDRRGRTLSENEFLQPFSKTLRALWRAGLGKHPRNMVIGPIINAYYGPGVLPGHDVRIDKVTERTASPKAAVVDVALVIESRPRKLRIDLVREAGSWRIDNLHYDNGDDFVSMRKRLIAGP